MGSRGRATPPGTELPEDAQDSEKGVGLMGIRDAVRRLGLDRRGLGLLATVALAAGVLVSLPASSAVAATSTTVVGNGDLSPNGPWALEPTSNTGTFSFVDGPNSPPSGVGSLAMNITSGNHEWLNNYAYGACATGPSCNNAQVNWTLLSSID